MPVFFPTKFNMKIRYVYNPDENPRHTCGPVTVPTTSDAALPSFRVTDPVGTGDTHPLASDLEHIPKSVLNPSVPQLMPDDSIPNEEPPKALQIILVILSIPPSKQCGTTSISPFLGYNIKSSLWLIDALVRRAKKKKKQKLASSFSFWNDMISRKSVMYHYYVE